MKKIKFLLPLLGLAFVGSVLAYSSAHSFTTVSVSTSNGHSYKGQFVSQGSFPFNGAGLFDRSKVNLKGTLTVTENDGLYVNQSTCFAVNGTLKANGGTVKTTEYTDTSCSVIYKRSTYTVSSYSEDGSGNFSNVVKDSAGVISTLQGSHIFQP